MPDALISSTTSRGPGVGSGKSRSSSRLSPRNTTPLIESLLLPTRPSQPVDAMVEPSVEPSLARKPQGAHRPRFCQFCIVPRLRSWAAGAASSRQGGTGCLLRHYPCFGDAIDAVSIRGADRSRPWPFHAGRRHSRRELPRRCLTCLAQCHALASFWALPFQPSSFRLPCPLKCPLKA